ncbi:MAG TPA: GAF domain-containing protein [bacterium]|nr:GAF domain-containing protein [bacterium]
MTSFVRQIIGFSRLSGADELRRRSAVGAQITMLHEIGRAMSTSMVSIEKTHELIAEAVCVVLGVEKAYLFLLDEERGDLVPRAGRGLVGSTPLSGLRCAPDGEFTVGRALKSTEVLRGYAEKERETTGAAKTICDALGLGHYLAAPLNVEGRAKGVLVADTRVGGHEFEPDDERLLMVLAYLAAIATENAERVQHLKDKSSRLAAVVEVGRALNRTLELSKLFDLIVDKALELTNATTGAILLLDEEKQVLTITASRNIAQDVVARAKLKLGEGITGAAAKEARTIVVPDVSKEPRYVVGNPSTRSEIAVPLFDEGRVVGVIAVDSDVPGNFHIEDRELLETFAGVAAVAIRNARLFASSRPT